MKNTQEILIEEIEVEVWKRRNEKNKFVFSEMNRIEFLFGLFWLFLFEMNEFSLFFVDF